MLSFNDFLKELKKVKVILSLQDEMSWQELFERQKNEAQKIKSIIDRTDNQIDLMVYKLYELTYEEAKIVDPDFDKVLNQFGLIPAEYERMNVEELAGLEK